MSPEDLLSWFDTPEERAALAAAGFEVIAVELADATKAHIGLTQAAFAPGGRNRPIAYWPFSEFVADSEPSPGQIRTPSNGTPLVVPPRRGDEQQIVANMANAIAGAVTEVGVGRSSATKSGTTLLRLVVDGRDYTAVAARLLGQKYRFAIAAMAYPSERADVAEAAVADLSIRLFGAPGRIHYTARALTADAIPDGFREVYGARWSESGNAFPANGPAPSWADRTRRPESRLYGTEEGRLSERVARAFADRESPTQVVPVTALRRLLGVEDDRRSGMPQRRHPCKTWVIVDSSPVTTATDGGTQARLRFSVDGEMEVTGIVARALGLPLDTDGSVVFHSDAGAPAVAAAHALSRALFGEPGKLLFRYGHVTPDPILQPELTPTPAPPTKPRRGIR